MTATDWTCRLQSLNPRDIRPLGWIRRYMQMDLAGGTTGRLDCIIPDIFADDLYGRDRRTQSKDWGETGSILDWEKENPTGKVEMKWWNAETQGNWWDGLLRTIWQVGTEADREKARDLVSRLLATQDEDGYLGVYGRDLRFQHTGENGELWAQAVLLRALFGWGEMTGDREVVDAALRAVDHTVAVLEAGAINPFAVEEGWGGVAHGLMFTDVCEVAHRLSGEERYLAFAVKLFEQFSETPSYTDDVRRDVLLRREIPFRGHGAHTYEHLRSLLLAAQVSGREDLKLAWREAMRKLQPCLLPSGAGIGFEFILGVCADAERTATEFCTMLELRNSLLSALQKLGDPEFGDRAELLTFNGILGARSGDGRHLAYCMPDSCYCLDAHEPREGQAEQRFKFSPAHQDVAVCCAPNAARQFPYYLASMWASEPAGFRALLYGPCEMTGDFAGAKVRIVEETDYPFSDAVAFHVYCDRPVRFRLSLRIPGWKGGMRLEAGSATVTREPGWVHMTREWKDETVRLSFLFEVEERLNPDGRYSLHRGPLLFVKPIPAKSVAFPKYANGEADLHFLPETPSGARHALPPEERKWTLAETDACSLWGAPALSLRGFLRADGRETAVSLVPMAGTVLRQASFDRLNDGKKTEKA